MARSTSVRVINKTGSTIPSNKVVYVSGYDSTSGLPTIGIASCNAAAMMPAIGITRNDIDNNTQGLVQKSGNFAGIYTLPGSINGPVFVGINGELLFEDPYEGDSGYLSQQLGVTVAVGDGSNGVIHLAPLEQRFRHADGHHESGSDEIDHGLIAGVQDDDHIIYTRTDGTRGFTGTISGAYPTSSDHLSTKGYVDGVINFLEHGDLVGLGDDDHTIYIKADGTRGFTGTVSGIYPTSDAHLATKEYVDDAASGGASGVAGSIQFSDGAAGLSSDGSNLFWDDGNDRLGINTNAPSSAVHIVGINGLTGSSTGLGTTDALVVENDSSCSIGIRASSSSEYSALKFLDSGGLRGEVLYNHSIDALSLATAGTKAISIDSNQFVGIGTESPERPLHVIGPLGKIPGTPDALSTSDTFVIENNGAAVMTFRGLSTTTYNGMRFKDESGTKAEIVYDYANDRMFMKNIAGYGVTMNTDAFVGISNDSPDAPLHIKSATWPVTRTERATSSGSGVWGTLAVKASYSGGGISDGFGPGIDFSVEDSTSGNKNIGRVFVERTSSSDNAGKLSLWTATTGGTVTRALSIDSSQKVGIGTSSPGSLLHIKGSSWTPLIIEATSNDPSIQLTSNSSADTNDWVIRLDTSESDALAIRYDNASVFTVGTGGNTRFGAPASVYSAPSNMLAIYGNASIGQAYHADAAPTNGLIVEGNVGIGTNSPAGNLHIVGTNPSIIISEDTDYVFQIQDISETTTYITKFGSGAGATLVDFSGAVANGTDNSAYRFHRYTNTSGLVYVDFMKGDGNNTSHARIASGTMNSYLCVGGGDLGVGKVPASGNHLDIQLTSTNVGFVDATPTGGAASGYITIKVGSYTRYIRLYT